MQPRILVKEQGIQQKKRFISPNQIKNYHGSGIPMSRVYSPPSTYETHRISNSNLHNNDLNRIQKQRQTLTNSKQGFFTQRPQNKSKSGNKKDYMMASLSKFNSLKGQTSNNNLQNDNKSRSSQNRDSIVSRGSKEKKIGQVKQKQINQTQKGNLYVQKQQPQQNLVTERKYIQTSRNYDIDLSKKQSEQNSNSNFTKKSAFDFELPENTIRQKTDIQVKQSKSSNFTSLHKLNVQSQSAKVMPNQSLNFREQSGSSIAIHLQKAHQQKQQLRQKKIQLQQENQLLKQKLQEKQKYTIQLKRELEQIQMQNIQINSNLKNLKVFETKTKYQLNDLNERNQQVFMQMNEKIQHLLKQQRNLIHQNELLKKQNDNLNTEIRNIQNRLKFSANKQKLIEDNMNQISNTHRMQLRNTIQEWKFKVQELERELMRKTSGQQNAGNLTGNMKVKIIQLETQISHKNQLIAKRDDQIRYLKAQNKQKVQTLQQIIRNRQKQLSQTQNEIDKSRKNLQKTVFDYENRIKEIKTVLVNRQKQIQKKRLQNQELKSNRISNQYLNVDSYYLKNSESKKSKQTESAKVTLEHLISSQTQQMNNYKKQLNKKVEEVFSLKSQNQELKSKNNNIVQEYKILQMQYSALQRKSSQTQGGQSSSMQMALIKSQLQINQRKIKQLQSKIQWKSKEIKQKDEFITNHLLRVTKQQNVIILLDKLKSLGIGNS